MRLADVQSNVKALLEAHPRLAGVPIILDDGLGEANKERVAALKAQGLSLLVWRIESGGIVDASSTGAVIQHLAIFVFIEENVAVCRAPGGLEPPSRGRRPVRHGSPLRRPRGTGPHHAR